MKSVLRDADLISEQNETQGAEQQSQFWRVGSKVPLNVYEGERPVCQCHSAEDAALIVSAVNRVLDRYLPR
jgi:hypothetical protein